MCFFHNIVPIYFIIQEYNKIVHLYIQPKISLTTYVSWKHVSYVQSVRYIIYVVEEIKKRIANKCKKVHQSVCVLKFLSLFHVSQLKIIMVPKSDSSVSLLKHILKSTFTHWLSVQHETLIWSYCFYLFIYLLLSVF